MCENKRALGLRVREKDKREKITHDFVSANINKTRNSPAREIDIYVGGKDCSRGERSFMESRTLRTFRRNSQALPTLLTCCRHLRA